jgi:hypothetical protein
MIARHPNGWGLYSSPAWRSVKQFIFAYYYEADSTKKSGPRARLEIRRAPPLELDKFSLMTVCCVNCGDTINPVRRRSGSSAYVAVTCDLRTKMGCARTRTGPLSASVEYDRIKEALKQASVQLSRQVKTRKGKKR